MSKGLRIPFTSNVIVQEDAFLDIIDQMRISIPDEVKQARRIGAERDHLLEQAQQEADRLVANAQETVNDLADEDEIVKIAQARSDEVVAQAHRSAEIIKAEADEYVVGMLSNMEEQLLMVITTVRNGIQQIERASSPRSIERQATDASRGVESAENPDVKL